MQLLYVKEVIQMPDAKPKAKLMKVSYYDSKAEIRLECYADTVVIEKEDRTRYIAAIRLGDYPESVKGMSDAIFGGGSVMVEIDGVSHTLSSRVKRYRRKYAHDGIYAEATLMVLDEEQRTDSTTSASIVKRYYGQHWCRSNKANG